MKVASIILESSNLSALGVNVSDIRRIHRDFNLEHDAEFAPIQGKAQAKQALEGGNMLIAVNDQGDAFGIGYRYRSGFANGTGMRVSAPKPLDGNERTTLTQALKIIPGRVYKMFASTESGVHNDLGRNWNKHDAEDTDHREELDAVIDRLNKVVQTDARKALGKVRGHLTRLGKKAGDENNTDEIDFKTVKTHLRILKGMAEKGVEGYDNGMNYSRSRGRAGALSDFLQVGGYENYDRFARSFQENHKLAGHKFIKFVRDAIRKHADRAIHGLYDQPGPKADEYKTAQDTFNRLNK